MRILLIFFSLCLFSLHAKSSEEAFSFPIPKDSSWKSRSFQYNAKTHSGYLVLVHNDQNSLLAEESLSIDWSLNFGIPPSKIKASLIDSLRQAGFSTKHRTLMHQGENIAFEVRTKLKNEERYQLYYIARMHPFNVTIKYSKENPKDIYQTRNSILPLMQKLTNSASDTCLSISSKGTFIEGKNIQMTEDEKFCALPNELFSIALPSYWEVNKGSNRKQKNFFKDSCFLKGKDTKNALDFSLYLDKTFKEPKEINRHITKLFEEEEVPGKHKTLWALDGKEITYSLIDKEDQKSLLISYIPSYLEAYRFEIEGTSKDLKKELPVIERVLMNFSCPWLPDQD